MTTNMVTVPQVSIENVPAENSITIATLSEEGKERSRIASRLESQRVLDLHTEHRDSFVAQDGGAGQGPTGGGRAGRTIRFLAQADPRVQRAALVGIDSDCAVDLSRSVLLSDIGLVGSDPCC